MGVDVSKRSFPRVASCFEPNMFDEMLEKNLMMIFQFFDPFSFIYFQELGLAWKQEFDHFFL